LDIIIYFTLEEVQVFDVEKLETYDAFLKVKFNFLINGIQQDWDMSLGEIISFQDFFQVESLQKNNDFRVL
jgi:hypothetical protein